MRNFCPLLLLPLLAAGLLLATAAGCRSTAFDPAAQRGPLRVSVLHRPLHPLVGQEVRITARAAGSAAQIRGSEITVTAVSGATGIATETCAGTATCTLVLPPAPAPTEALYAASVIGPPPASDTVRSPGTYLFAIDRRPDQSVVPLRVSLFPGDDRDVLLVRDGGTYATDAGALEDLEHLLYDQVLQDPVYRWRDGLLSFHYTTHPGRTTGARSGSLLRCGQEPWLGLPDQTEAEDAAAFAEVVGVVHRLDDARDCSGLGIVTSGAGARARFAAHGERPVAFQHELGHALFGLSDEYSEPAAERTFPAGPRPDRLDCQCCPSGGSDRPDACPPGMRSCDGFVPPPECYPATEVCPPLASTCPRGNVFADRAACTAAAEAADRHPGVEAAAAPADCRLLCSNADPTSPCPCDRTPEREVWVLDRHTPPAAAAGGDLMAETSGPEPNHHGPACALCAEVQWCLTHEGRRVAAGELSRDAALERCRAFGGAEPPPPPPPERRMLDAWRERRSGERLVRVAAVYRLGPEGLGMRVMAARVVDGALPAPPTAPLPSAAPAGGRVELLDAAGGVLASAPYLPAAPPGERGTYGDVLHLRLPWVEGAERVRLVEAERGVRVEARLER